MNLRRLRLFLSVSTENSISRAARAHGIAQPALTRQIQLLEAAIGAQLFERSSRGLRLTEVGQFLKDALELPVSEVETALRSARSYTNHLKAPLTLGIPPSLSELFGPRLVERVRRELPNNALRIVEEDSSKLAADLSRRVIDAAILVSIIPDQRVSHAPVVLESLMLVGSPGMAALAKGELALSRLADLPLVLPSERSGLRINLDRAAETAGIKIAPIMQVDSIELSKQLVQSGECYAIMPLRACRHEIAPGQARGRCNCQSRARPRGVLGRQAGLAVAA